MANISSIKFCRCEFGGYDFCVCDGSGIIIEYEGDPVAKSENAQKKAESTEFQSKFTNRVRADQKCIMAAFQMTLFESVKTYNLLIARINRWRDLSQECNTDAHQIEQHIVYILTQSKDLKKFIEDRVVSWNYEKPKDKMILRKENNSLILIGKRFKLQ